MPQGAGYGGKDTGSSDPRGGQGRDGHYGGGGVGPHGGAPGYRGGFFGGNFGQNGTNSGGPRRQQGTIATRPGTWGNIGTALGSLLPGGGLITGLHGLINGNLDPYTGPIGHTGWSGADTIGESGLIQSLTGHPGPRGGVPLPPAPMAPPPANPAPAPAAAPAPAQSFSLSDLMAKMYGGDPFNGRFGVNPGLIGYKIGQMAMPGQAPGQMPMSGLTGRKPLF